jgi:glycosyltransferase involved in cell wall biosynthesis
MISCVIPTRNEAHNLAHALASLHWCDEVVVVDMESTDGTPELALSLGARVMAVEHSPDFNLSRKFGLDAARNEWVLALDADEMVPPALAEALLDVAHGSKYDVGVMPRLNFKFGIQRGGSLWPDYQRRLYRKDAVGFVTAIHQYLEIRSKRVKWLPVRDELALHHFNFSPLAQQIEKLNKYTTTDALYAHEPTAGSLSRIGLRRFAALHVKHGGWKEGIPGFWWSAHSAFYDMAQHNKWLEFTSKGTVEETQRFIEQLNRETSIAAKIRLDRGERRHTVSLARSAWKFATSLRPSGSLDSAVWRAASNAFRDLLLEMKVWEMVEGRTMAERAQDETRSALASQWAEQVG